MSPSYREPQTTSFLNELLELSTSMDTCIEAMTLKTKYIISNFKPWKEKILSKVK